MAVKMVVDAGPGRFPDICPDIEAARLKSFLQYPDTPADQLEVLVPFFFRKLCQVAGMTVGGYQQMAGIIGIAVQHDEVLLTAVEYIIPRVSLLLGFIAQDAAFRFFLEDILNAPRRPDIFHDALPAGAILSVK
jgi:hypothetical protein